MFGVDYLNNLMVELSSFKPSLVDNVLYVTINGVDINIYNNSYALLINEGKINKHIVPIMLSCTDVFIMTYLKSHYIDKIKNRQLSIFDFI